MTSHVARRRGPVGRVVAWLANLAISAAAVLTLIGLVGGIAIIAFGIRPLVVQSGSMAPAIPTGSLALTHEIAAIDVAVGDVVSVETKEGERITHRVLRNGAAGGAVRQLTLRGDANPEPDAMPYVEASVHKVVWHIPHAGYAIAWFAGPEALLVVGAMGGCAIILVSLTRPRVARRMTVSIAVLAALAAAGHFTGIRPPTTQASFTDTVEARTGAWSAYSVPKPSLGALGAQSCAVTGNALTGFTATIRWPAITAPRDLTYTVNIAELPGTPLTVHTSGGNREVRVMSGLLSSLLGSTVHVRVRAHLPGSLSWASTTAERELHVGLLGLSLTCGSVTS